MHHVRGGSAGSAGSRPRFLCSRLPGLAQAPFAVPQTSRLPSGTSLSQTAARPRVGGRRAEAGGAVTAALCPAVLCGPPPEVDNAFPVGRRKEKYSIHATVRYQCADGFMPRHVPTVKCHSNGKWDRPKLLCTRR